MSAGLQVFNPGRVPGRGSLADAFAELVLPHLRRHGRAQDTIQGYRRAVALWSEWEAEAAQKYRMCNPVPLSDVNSGTLEKFREWLSSARRSSARTANKTLGAVQAILEFCARYGEGDYWIESAPRISPLPHSPQKPKLYFRFLLREEIGRLEFLRTRPQVSAAEADELAELRRRDELSRLYRACSAAFWPSADRSGRPLDPRDQWRALILVLSVYGCRLGEVVATRPRHTALTWGQVSWEPETPVPGYHASNPSGWLWYVPQKQQRAKSEPLVLPLLPVVSEHLRRIRPRGQVPSSEPVFNWPSTKASLYGCWSAILAQAAFSWKRDLRTGRELRLRPENLRKTCVTWLNYHQPGLAPLVTGHAAREASLDALAGTRVVSRHYDNAEASLVEQLNALPIPEGWLAAASPAGRQLRLF